MKNLITKSMVKILIAIVLCAILSMAISNIAPHISNDVAIGQLENDDMSWTVMQTWNQTLKVAELGYAAIWIVCLGSVGMNTIKYIKSRKENDNEEL